MSWSEFDDEQDDGRAKKSGRRMPKRFDETENGNEYKKKRSGKRFHRKKTLKDEFWEENTLRRPPRHGPEKHPRER